jgi:hypothetical protein
MGISLPVYAQQSENGVTPAPFSVGEVVRRVSHRAKPVGDGSFFAKDRNVDASFNDPGSPSLSMLLQEFMIDTSITYLGAIGDQEYASVAFDGTNYLVVWQDHRNPDLDIYGARVDTSGTVLDSSGIPISAAAGDQEYPSVAFDGTNYLVVWDDSRSVSDHDIYGARVNTSGTVLDPSGAAISIAASEQLYPSLAFDGTNYLVVWSDYRNGSDYDLYGARVDTSGTVLDPSGIAISAAAGDQDCPWVAFDGTNCLVVWEDYRSASNWDIYGARVDTSGAVLDPSGIAISIAADHQEYPSVAFDGTYYLVVWEDHRSVSDIDIYGARVDASGTVLDPSGTAISAAVDDQGYPSVAFDGTNYLVVWEDHRSGSDSDIYGARVDTSGTVLEPSGIAISTAAGYQWSSRVASDGTDCLVAWHDYGSGPDEDIYGARVDTSGTVLEPSGTIISTAPAPQPQYYPSVAFDGTNYLVVWADHRSGSGYDIYGARVTDSGTVLDPSGIAVCNAVNEQYSPSVAFDGTDYLVVWQDYRSGIEDDIYGARVTASGTVLDPSGIAISSDVDYQEVPSVAFDGTNYLVVWEDLRNGYDNTYGARVDTSGTVLDPLGIAISTGAYDEYSPSVAFDGTNYLIVWYDSRSAPGYDIYGARVDTSGTVLDPSNIAISAAADNQESPSVAFDGTDYLVVWRDHRGGSGSSDEIYGTRVDASGTVLDPPGIAVSTAAGDQSYPSVAFDGTNYLVVWEDYRNGVDSDIYGARVDVSGTLLDPSGIELVNQPYERRYPAVARGPNSQLLIVYDGFASDPYNTDRVFGAFYPEVGVEERPEPGSKTPQARLEQGYPNPFSQSAVIRYQVPAPARVALRVYDISGRLVRTLVDGEKGPGLCTEVWDGADDSGNHVTSGIYFCELRVLAENGKVNNFRAAEKLILMR